MMTDMEDINRSELDTAAVHVVLTYGEAARLVMDLRSDAAMLAPNSEYGARLLRLASKIEAAHLDARAGDPRPAR